MNKKAISVISIFLPVAVMVFIFVQSSLPADLSMQESDPIAEFLARLPGLELAEASVFVRKTAHFLEYAVLGASLIPLSMRLVSKRSKQEPLFTAGFFAWVIGAVYACTDEFHQRFVPGRSGELRDIAIDAAGVLAGVLVVCLILRKKERKKS